MGLVIGIKSKLGFFLPLEETEGESLPSLRLDELEEAASFLAAAGGEATAVLALANEDAVGEYNLEVEEGTDVRGTVEVGFFGSERRAGVDKSTEGLSGDGE